MLWFAGFAVTIGIVLGLALAALVLQPQQADGR